MALRAARANRFRPIVLGQPHMQTNETPSSQDSDSAEAHSPPKTAGTAPRVFISYTHEDQAHKAWVASLATDLRRNHVDAILDQWEMRLGGDLPLFMEKGIRESQRVLLICTPTFARKANEGQGGVGYERLVVTGELAKKIDTEKFICVLRCGDRDDAIPTFAQSRLFVDFRKDEEYDAAFDKLLRDIHNAPIEAKPPLGANPFERETQRSTASLPRVTADERESAVELAQRAAEILRARDFLGWRKLVRDTRRKHDGRLAAWRDSLRELPAEDAEWVKLMHEALDVAAPYFALALTAYESELPEVSQQAGLLDDLIAPGQWNRSGDRRVVHAPEALAMSYHFLVGACMLDNGWHGKAVALLMMPVRHAEPEDSPTPLWRHDELMGFTHAIGHNCIRSWDFLVACFVAHAWLREFFTSEREYVDSLRAYQLLAGLVEMAEYAARGGSTASIESQHFGLSVPPMFMYGVQDPREIGPVVLRGTSNGQALSVVAQAYGTTAEKMMELWPHWFRAMVLWYGSAGMRNVPLRIRAAPPLVAGRSWVTFTNPMR